MNPSGPDGPPRALIPPGGPVAVPAAVAVGGGTVGGVTIAVCADDLLEVARVLGGPARMLDDALLDVGLVAVRAGLSNDLLSPLTGARVAGDVAGLTVLPGHLRDAATELHLLAGALRVAAATYAGAETTAGMAAKQVEMTKLPFLLLAVQGLSMQQGEGLGSVKDAAVTVGNAEPGLWSGLISVVAVLIGGDQALTGPGFELTVGGLLAGLRAAGWARDDRPITASPVPSRTDRQPPGDLEGLLRESHDVESGGRAEYSVVRVRHVVAPDGSGAWVVQIPGTQTWDPHQPANPSDLAANVALLAGRDARLLGAVESALRAAMGRAGVAPGSQPVMLVGHSQGGMVATRLAARPGFARRYDVRQVVTAGSPVSNMRLPAGVTSFDLEHWADVVPRLDDQAAPRDQRNRVGLLARPAPRPGGETGPTSTHDVSRYADTARDLAGRDSTDPNVLEFYADNDVFLRHDATDEVYEYDLRRE